MAETAAGMARRYDRKRYLWPGAVVFALLPVFGGALAFITGWNGFWFLSPFFVYVLIPVADFLVGADPSNPPDEAVPALEADPYYRWCVYAFVPFQYLVTIWAVWQFAYGGLGPLALAGLTVSLGILSGTAINTAHELGHKPTELERWLSKLALAPVAYGHFYVEHNRGHHRRVATPGDPASARMGEGFWRFLPRTVFGSLRSAWALEAGRLAREGKPAWHWSNDNLQAWAMTVVLFGVFVTVFGWRVLPFLVAQSLVGISLLEAVNYVEHYGLLRRKLEDGRCERCRPEHSWNNNHTVTNVMLYHLQRHSDHHANPRRRYPALRHFDSAPQLPTGYAGMILLAYFPPLWYRVMDPKVVAQYGGDIRRANLQPGRADALLKKYPPPAAAC